MSNVLLQGSRGKASNVMLAEIADILAACHAKNFGSSAHSIPLPQLADDLMRIADELRAAWGWTASRMR